MAEQLEREMEQEIPSLTECLTQIGWKHQVKVVCSACGQKLDMTEIAPFAAVCCPRCAGRVVRPGFCGWSALGPISLYLENVIGLSEADAFARTLNWSLPKKVKGRIGVRNYRFGDVLADLIVENGMLTARSSWPFRLILNGTGLDIPGGECRIVCRK